MSDPARYRFNLVAWVAVSLTLCTSSVRGLWVLSEMAHDVRQASEQIHGIRVDLKTASDDINNLRDRTARIEEHIKIVGEIVEHPASGKR